MNRLACHLAGAALPCAQSISRALPQAPRAESRSGLQPRRSPPQQTANMSSAAVEARADGTSTASTSTEPPRVQRSPLARQAAKLLHRRLKVRGAAQQQRIRGPGGGVQASPARLWHAGGGEGRQGASGGADVPRQARQRHLGKHLRAAGTERAVSAGARRARAGPGAGRGRAVGRWSCVCNGWCSDEHFSELPGSSSALERAGRLLAASTPASPLPHRRKHEKQMGLVLVPAEHRVSCEVEASSWGA